MMNQKASMLLMLIRWYMFEASFSLMFAKSSIDDVITSISSNESDTRRGVGILEELVNETKDLC